MSGSSTGRTPTRHSPTEWSARGVQRPAVRGATALHLAPRPSARFPVSAVRTGAAARVASAPGKTGESSTMRAFPRRRRVSRLRRWLPTIIVVSFLATVPVLLVGRLLTSGRDAAPSQVAVQSAVTAEQRPASLEASPPAPLVDQAPARRVRSTIANIEPNYTVATGDTLSAIAQRYNTTIDALVSINNLPDRTITLRVGQRLLLP